MGRYMARMTPRRSTIVQSSVRAQPGTREIYSNSGYAIVAAVIEQLTEKSYDAYVRDDLLAPRGLENTGYLLPRFDPSRIAH